MVRRITLFCIVVLITLTTTADALVINEVLANEPKSKQTLEWLEIYNPSDSVIDLANFYLVIAGNVLPINETVIVRGDEYVVLCRKLIGDSNSDGFESYWGDSSGVWGDDPAEAAMITPVELPIALKNSGDTIQLFDNSGQLYSTFVWSSGGTDGYSWERRESFSDSIWQSQDRTGSSPGRMNSITPLNQDLGIKSATVTKTLCTETIYDVVVQSHSRQTVEFATLWIHLPLGDTVTFVGLPPIMPDSLYRITGEIVLPGKYVELEISLSSDDRDNNHHVTKIFAGDSYEPLMLSELMVNPSKEIGSEWIELFNSSDDWIDLGGYSFTVGHEQVLLSDLSANLAPGEFYTLAQDKQAVMNYYGVGVNVSEPSTWPAMRNSSDTIRLIDTFGVIVDELVYNEIPENGYTLSRDNFDNKNCRWGVSADYGGTPGVVNLSLFNPSNEQLALSVEPNIFSPTGSAQNSKVIIKIVAPAADNYTLAIYDRHGRLVRSIFDGESLIPDEVRWDGRSDNGTLLPIGIYIIFGEAYNIGSVKKTVVIAP